MNTVIQDLKPGKYTFISIGGMAMTMKTEVEITLVTDEGNVIFKRPGKRKLFQFRPKVAENLVFAGWALPLKVDSDFRSFAGNACLNLRADSLEIAKDFVENKALFPVGDNLKGAMLFKTTYDAINSPENFDNDTVMYPELVREGMHAVMDKIVRKQKAA